jgi:hypothetical protein
MDTLWTPITAIRLMRGIEPLASSCSVLQSSASSGKCLIAHLNGPAVRAQVNVCVSR